MRSRMSIDQAKLGARLIPHAAEILIQTRWHEDDLAGRALNHEEWAATGS
jgi:hypothetical protein